MGFNLTTFLAQIVNLFLLIWILKRFLYRPVLAVIEKRRQQIAHSIQEADEKLAEADQTQKTVAKLKEDFEKKRQKRLDDLDQEIHQHREQLLKELEKEYQSKQQKLQATLDSNWTSAENTIQQMIGREFVTLAQKILTEWSSQSPVDQMLILFAKKVKALSQNKKKQIQTILKQQKSVQVITSATLTKAQQNNLKEILSKNFVLPPKMRLQYKKHSDLILGLEIRIGDFSLDWNLNTYLNEMNERLKQGISGLIISTERKADK